MSTANATNMLELPKSEAVKILQILDETLRLPAAERAVRLFDYKVSDVQGVLAWHPPTREFRMLALTHDAPPSVLTLPVETVISLIFQHGEPA